jgi:hypothetical protein
VAHVAADAEREHPGARELELALDRLDDVIRVGHLTVREQENLGRGAGRDK